MIPRLYYIEARFSSKEYIGSVGLDAFIGGVSGGKAVEKYKLIYYGVIVQEEGSKNLLLLGPDDEIILLQGYEEYCHWHNGPLWSRDDPLSREYCTRPAAGELGYCSVHRNSLRALYTRCFGSSGLESLRSCWMLDEKLGERVEYAVYLLAYNHNRFKVGSTRYWRLYERLGEQPHVLATILYRSKSAVKTRDVEIRAGRLEGLTERPRRSLREVVIIPPAQVINRLEKTLAKTRRLLGLKDDSEPRFIRVEPASGFEKYYRVPEKKLGELVGKHLYIRDYYAGYLLLEEVNTSQKYLLKGNNLLHVNSIKLVK